MAKKINKTYKQSCIFFLKPTNCSTPICIILIWFIATQSIGQLTSNVERAVLQNNWAFVWIMANLHLDNKKSWTFIDSFNDLFEFMHSLCLFSPHLKVLLVMKLISESKLINHIFKRISIIIQENINFNLQNVLVIECDTVQFIGKIYKMYS